jgi:peroxiredoxin Q/BCP
MYSHARSSLLLSCFAVLAALLAGCGARQRPDGGKGHLPVGAEVPALTSDDQLGRRVELREKVPTLLYFFPRSGMPGCTKEACAFRDDFAAFKKKGAVVLGVSTDSVKKHDKFVEKFGLPFTLLADEDKQIVQAYGVWGEKSFMGRKYMGTHRVTVLIGPDGVIKKIWPTVKPEQHAAEVLAAI